MFGGKRGFTIAAAGTAVPVFLLNESHQLYIISPATTAGALCVSIREQMGLKNDSGFSLYEWHEEAGFRIIDDTLVLGRVLSRWPQENAFGPRRLLYKRSVYLPRSPAEMQEVAAVSAEDGAHRLAYIDAEYHFIHGYYRMEPLVCARVAAHLLASYRGAHDPLRDSAYSILPIVADLVPLWALKGPGVPNRDTHPRGHGVAQASTALSIEQMARLICACYEELGGSGAESMLAQRHFVASCKASAVYGREVFYGKRTWKETLPPGSVGVGGAPSDIARTEDVCVAVGHTGVMLLASEDPLRVDLFAFAAIQKWVVSRDGAIFAMSVSDGGGPRIVYVATDLAGFLEMATERYVAELMRYRAGAGESKWAPARAPAGAAGGLATPGARSTPALPPYATLPSRHAIDAAQLATATLYSTGRTTVVSSVSGRDGGVVNHADDDDDDDDWVGSADVAAAGTIPRGAAAAPAAVLPRGWTQHADAEGNAYFVNAISGETSWHPPDPEVERLKLQAGLPDGWTVSFDVEGDPFYSHVPTSTSSWYRPNPDGTAGTV